MKTIRINVSNYPEQRELKDNEIVDHLEASITNESYRIYIAENIYILPGNSRLDALRNILKDAQAREDYEFCARIKSVYKRLKEKYQSEVVI